MTLRVNENYKMKDIIEITNSFNNTFTEYGWIATDDFSVSIMEKALETYRNKGIASAEDYFCSVFNDQYFSTCIHRMKAILIFKGRERLVEFAYIDHKEKRFHASIPVVLSQIDGLVHDIAKQSFYERYERTKIFQYTSKITGLVSTLDKVAQNMNQCRKQTNFTPLNFPYRNGILHGRDINYDSEIVSTKCFFNLFALRTWGLFIQNNEFDKILNPKQYIKIPGFVVGDKMKLYMEEAFKEKV